MIETQIPKEIMQKYLEEIEGKEITILEYDRLGSGWHGTGYRIRYQIDGVINAKDVILRTLRPVDFSHDLLSDRAKVFVLQHELSNSIPDHVRSIDVGGYSNDGGLVSIGNVKEFFQLVEVASGTNYSEDLSRILKKRSIEQQDKEKAKSLSDYLVDLHDNKFKGDIERVISLRRRHSRDALGHGEMMLGVIDTYPKKKWIADSRLTGIICKAAKFREKIKDTPFIPRLMHGDFHPGNIMFNGLDFKVLDASREFYGDPADDVCTMAMNYIWFAVMQTGKFNGPFKELFDIYWDNYMFRTKDKLITRTAALHFAFRGVVVVHPVFYKDQDNSVRNKIIRFIDNVLDDSSFKPSKINDYLR